MEQIIKDIEQRKLIEQVLANETKSQAMQRVKKEQLVSKLVYQVLNNERLKNNGG